MFSPASFAIRAHVNELDKTYDPVIADLAMRRKVDSELERLLCMYRHDTRAYLKALDELETKYVVTPDAYHQI